MAISTFPIFTRLSSSHLLSLASMLFVLNAIFPHSSQAFQLSPPKGFEVVRDLYGAQLSVLGEMKDGFRPVLIVEPTKQPGPKEWNRVQVGWNVDEFYRGRQEWLSSKPGNWKWEGALPIQMIQQGKIKGFKVGFAYTHDGKTFVDQSFYLTCSEKFVFAKTMSLKNQMKDHDRLEQTILSMNCDSNQIQHPENKAITAFQRQMQKEAFDVKWRKKDFEAMNDEQRVEVLKAFREFLEDSKTNHVLEIPSGKKSAWIQKLKDTFSIHQAVAAAGGQCFYAGWPSVLKRNPKGQVTCAVPEGYDAGQCQSNEIACHPFLFGENACIKTDIDFERNHATTLCGKRGVPADQLKKPDESSEKQMQEYLGGMASLASQLCKDPGYVSTNGSQCLTLVNRLDSILNLGGALISEVATDPATAEQQLDTLYQDYNNQYQKFSPTCTAKATVAPPDCDTLAVELTEKSNLMEKILADQAQVQSSDGSEDLKKNQNNPDCENCGPGGLLNPRKLNVCSVDQLKKVKSEAHLCDSLIQGAKNRIWGFVRGVVRNLWSNVTAIPNLLVNIGKGVWNWAFGKEAEDQVSDKALIAGQTDPNETSADITDERSFMGKLWDGILSFKDTLKANEVLCREWNATYTECKQPADLENYEKCTGCAQKAYDDGKIYGYITAEVLPLIFTGGAMASTKVGWINKFQKAHKALSKTSQWHKKIRMAPRSGFKKVFGQGGKATSTVVKGSTWAQKISKRKQAVDEYLKLRKAIKLAPDAAAALTGKMKRLEKILKINPDANWFGRTWWSIKNRFRNASTLPIRATSKAGGSSWKKGLKAPLTDAAIKYTTVLSSSNLAKDAVLQQNELEYFRNRMDESIVNGATEPTEDQVKYYRKIMKVGPEVEEGISRGELRQLMWDTKAEYEKAVKEKEQRDRIQAENEQKTNATLGTLESAVAEMNNQLQQETYDWSQLSSGSRQEIESFIQASDPKFKIPAVEEWSQFSADRKKTEMKRIREKYEDLSNTHPEETE